MGVSSEHALSARVSSAALVETPWPITGVTRFVDVMWPSVHRRGTSLSRQRPALMTRPPGLANLAFDLSTDGFHTHRSAVIVVRVEIGGTIIVSSKEAVSLPAHSIG